MVRIVLLPVLAALVSALGSLPNLCITEPPLLLVAGKSTVQATNYSPGWWDCWAIIQFSNLAFAPITYHYGAGSCYSGPENASFLVPPGVPNGDAFVTWTCGTYVQACVRAIISNGRGDPDLPAFGDVTMDCESFQNYDQSTSHHTSKSIGSPSSPPTSAITTPSTQPNVAPGGSGAPSLPPTTFTGTMAASTASTGSAGPDLQTSPSASASTEGRAADESSVSVSNPSGVTAAITTVTTTPNGLTRSDSQTDSRTPASTDGSAADQSFANINTASRLTTPSFARSLFTVTRTVTTLITTTLTARR